MAVTQEEIAQKLGVSRRLVGSALSGNPRVSAETRRRVAEMAQSMGYEPNAVGRALVTGRTNLVALYLPDIETVFNADLIREFELLARQTPYRLVVLTYNRDGATPSPVPVDGTLIYARGSGGHVLIRQKVVTLQARPYVEPGGETSTPYPDVAGDLVEFDLQEAAHLAMRHLIDQGIRRIALVSPPSLMLPHKPRFESYAHEMERAGLRQEQIPLRLEGEVRLRDVAAEQLEAYFRRNGFPEALFCSNDDIAIGAYRALRKLEHPFPARTAIIGCDDIDAAQDLSPSLTSIRPRTRQVCQIAWQQLLERIVDPERESRSTIVQAELVVRESSVIQSLAPASPNGAIHV